MIRNSINETKYYQIYSNERPTGKPCSNVRPMAGADSELDQPTQQGEHAEEDGQKGAEDSDRPTAKCPVHVRL